MAAETLAAVREEPLPHPQIRSSCPHGLSLRATQAAVALLTTAAALTRVWALRIHDELNADEALPGLMARHIAAGREAPVFYYGQHYFGAVEAYLVAGLDRLAGFHPWFIYVPPVVASSLLVLVTYALGAAAGGRAGGLFAALLVAVPPPMLARLYADGGGGFSLAFLLHGLLLLCTLRALQSTRHALAWLAIGSLLAGVLIWIWQPAAVLYVALVVLLASQRAALRSPAALVALSPVLLGLLPPLLYNARLGWPSVLELAHKYAAPANEASTGPRGDAMAVLQYLWIALGGGNEAEGGASPALAGTVVLGALLAGALLWRDRLSAPRPVWQPRVRAAAVLAAAALVDVAAAHNTTRHLAPAVLATYALAGAGLGLLARRRVPERRSRSRQAVGQDGGRRTKDEGGPSSVLRLSSRRLHDLTDTFGLVVALGAAGAVLLPTLLLWRDADQTFQHFVARQSEATEAAQVLMERGLTDGYSDYWSAYPIMFLSGEAVVIAPAVPAPFGGRFDRYPAYTQQVDATEDPSRLFLLLDNQCSSLPYVLVLEQHGATYQLERLARWYLLWDIEPQPGAAGETLAAWRQVLYDRQYC